MKVINGGMFRWRLVMSGVPRDLSWDQYSSVSSISVLEMRRFQGDLIAAFQYSMGTYTKEGDQLFKCLVVTEQGGMALNFKSGNLG